jgi:7-carboxy-7-deazaguanine synthase
MSLKVNEIFFSIQGESSHAGRACAFVRLTGCNLRCGYCDTKYAYEEGEELTIEEVVAAISKYPTKLVEVTGGEPLLQPETLPLITALADAGGEVLIETNGTVSLEGIDERAAVIMDIKCPGSGMSDKVLWDNIGLLRARDEVKFVLIDRADFDWAIEAMGKYGLADEHIIHMAPAHGALEPRRLAEWILEDCPDARLGLQLHKYIWPDVERGV